MTATKKSTIQEFAAAQGWVLDPTKSVNTHFLAWGPSWESLSPAEKARYIKQDPNAFVKAAADGGTWKVQLEFNDGGKVLRAVELRYFDAAGVERVIGDPSDPFKTALSRTGYVSFGYNGNWPDNKVGLPGAWSIGSAILANPARYSGLSSSWLWDAARPATNDGPLRKQAEVLLADVELLVWLAAEKQFVTETRWAAERAAKERIAALKAQQPEGWNTLRQAARDIINAHGLDDHKALIEALVAAAAGVEV
jgi:hypothetical protein